MTASLSAAIVTVGAIGEGGEGCWERKIREIMVLPVKEIFLRERENPEDRFVSINRIVVPTADDRTLVVHSGVVIIAFQGTTGNE